MKCLGGPLRISRVTIPFILMLCIFGIVSVSYADVHCVAPSQRLNVGKSLQTDTFLVSGYLRTISGDGAQIVLDSDAISRVLGISKAPGLYLYNRITGSSELVTIATDGTPLPMPSYSVKLIVSDDSRYVAFEHPDDKIYLRDRTLQQTTIIADNGRLDTLTGDGKLISYSSGSITTSDLHTHIYDVATKSVSTDVIDGVNDGGASVWFQVARDGNSFIRTFKGVIGSRTTLNRAVVNSVAVYSRGVEIEAEKKGDFIALPVYPDRVLTKQNHRDGIKRYAVREDETYFNPIFFSRRKPVNVVDVSTDGQILLVHGQLIAVRRAFEPYVERYLAVNLEGSSRRCFAIPSNVVVYDQGLSGDGKSVIFLGRSLKTKDLVLLIFPSLV